MNAEPKFPKPARERSYNSEGYNQWNYPGREKCSVEICQSLARSKGYCIMHYTRWRNGRDLSLPQGKRVHEYERPFCVVEECGLRAFGKKEYCCKHYYQVKATGQPHRLVWGRNPTRVKGQCICEDKGLCKFCQTRTNLRNIKNRSKDQERQLAREYQESGFTRAKRVPASGALKGLPGDVEVEDFLLAEAKMSSRGTLTIKPEWIDKIRRQAREAGKKNWALHAWVKEGDNNYRKVVIVDPDFFFSLIGKELNETKEDS